MSELKQIRKEIRRYAIANTIYALLTLDFMYFLTGDSIRIYRYDCKKRRGLTHIPLPSLRSDISKDMLERLLDAYEAENLPQSHLKLPNWTCSCGRENQHYVSTCPCGKSKKDNQHKEK